MRSLIRKIKYRKLKTSLNLYIYIYRAFCLNISKVKFKDENIIKATATPLRARL